MPSFLSKCFLDNNGSKNFNSGPLFLPVRAHLSGINKSLPFLPVLSLIFDIHSSQVFKVNGSIGSKLAAKLRNSISLSL